MLCDVVSMNSYFIARKKLRRSLFLEKIFANRKLIVKGLLSMLVLLLFL